MKKIVRIAATLAAAPLLGSLTPSPAVASTTFAWRIDVNRTDLSAVAYVHDSLGATFTGTLTAVGTVTCGLISPQSVVAASDQGTGNPLYLRTPGTCTPYNGVVTYDLSWTGLIGSSGHHTVVCVAHLGAVTCSLPGLAVYA